MYGIPDTTPFIADFPDANLVSSSFNAGFSVYSYSKINAEKWEELGTAASLFKKTYTNPKTTLTFPFTFNSSVSDDYEGIEELGISSIVTHFNGISTTTADAYGSVMLPGGSFDDVLRLKLVTKNTDSTDLGANIIEKLVVTTTTYIWYSPEYHSPLCSQSSSEGIQIALVPGLAPDTAQLQFPDDFSWDPAAIVSAIKSIERIDFTISPNPFTDYLDIRIDLEDSGSFMLDIIGLDGKRVYSEKVESATGVFRHRLQPDLPSGQYFLRLKGENSAGFQKLIKL
jgi:hypothetical protein